MPGILPEMSLEESLEVTRIYSVADQLPPGTPLIRNRPFRAPHHTISHAGLVGGGNIPRPGEISLAHRGVLFLDEFPDRVTADRPGMPAEVPVATLEELILTRIANENPAATPVRDLFDDRPLAGRTDYEGAVEALDAFFSAQPGFGPDGETLLELLRAPARHSPTSLAGQLRYIRERWGARLGVLLDRLLADGIAEEYGRSRAGGGAASLRRRGARVRRPGRRARALLRG
jgi:hypothetical protein